MICPSTKHGLGERCVDTGEGIQEQARALIFSFLVAVRRAVVRCWSVVRWQAWARMRERAAGRSPLSCTEWVLLGLDCPGSMAESP